MTFTVNVSGTAATPSVRCIVGEHPALSFQAAKLALADAWEVLIDLPKGMKVGSYPLKVEVLLNGRLFTPINTTVPVTGEAEPKIEEPKVEVKVEPVEVEVEVQAPKVEPIEIKIEPTKIKPKPMSLMKQFTPESKVPPREVPSIPIQKPKAIPAAVVELPPEIKPIIPVKPVTIKPAPSLTGLEKLVAPVVRTSPTPVKTKVEVKRVKISMADVANDVHTREPKKKTVSAPAKVHEAQKTIPISLTKGEVIYR